MKWRNVCAVCLFALAAQASAEHIEECEAFAQWYYETRYDHERQFGAYDQEVLEPLRAKSRELEQSLGDSRALVKQVSQLKNEASLRHRRNEQDLRRQGAIKKQIAESQNKAASDEAEILRLRHQLQKAEDAGDTSAAAGLRRKANVLQRRAKQRQASNRKREGIIAQIQRRIEKRTALNRDTDAKRKQLEKQVTGPVLAAKLKELDTIQDELQKKTQVVAESRQLMDMTRQSYDMCRSIGELRRENAELKEQNQRLKEQLKELR